MLVSPSMFAAPAWPDTLRECATFVDVGSGTGRVVLLAAMQRFREVVGVEASPELHAIAERNVARGVAAGVLRSPVRLVQEDASAFVIPSQPLVVHLDHPFGEDVADLLVTDLIGSCLARPRPVALVYSLPAQPPRLAPRVFEAGRMFRKATEGGRWAVWTNFAWLAMPQAQAA